MAVFLLTLTLLVIIMAIMAVGVIFSNKELKGSCGGPGQCECELAGRPKACEAARKMAEAIEALNEQNNTPS
jgi:hypothetical protein